MRYYSWVSTSLFLAMLLASLNNIALGNQPLEFNISIDEQMRSKWGAEYPVTYVFHVSDISPHTAVLRRDGDSASFRPLERKTSKDVFNGAECVRYEGPRNTGYVSVGFGKTNQIQLKFTDAGTVVFDRVANYYRYYGIGGDQTKSYDAILKARRPKGRYYAEDVAALNRAFDTVYQQGGIFYAMFHADRYQNSVLYDPRPGVEGVAGSTLMRHFSCVANRRDVWYVANGWLYCYRHVAEHAKVARKE